MKEYLKKNYKKFILIIAYIASIAFNLFSITNVLNKYVLNYILIVPVAMSIANIIVSIIGLTNTARNRYRKYAYFLISASISIASIILAKIFGYNNSDYITYQIFGIIIGIGSTIYFYFVAKTLPKNDESYDMDIKHAFFDWSSLITNIAINILVILIFVTPYYSTENTTFILMNSLNTPGNDLIPSIAAFVFLVLWMISFIQLSNVITLFACGHSDFARKSKQNVLYVFGISLAFSASGYLLAFIQTIVTKSQIVSTAYLPVLVIGVIAIIHSIFVARSGFVKEEDQLETKNTLQKVLILIFVILLTISTFVSIWINIVTVDLLDSSKVSCYQIIISGKDLINNYTTMSKGFRLIAFVLLLFLFSSLGLLIGSLISFCSKSKYFKKVALVTVILNFIFVFVIGAFGAYYKIINEIDKETLTTLLTTKYPFITFNLDLYDTSVTSQSFFLTIADAIICTIILVLKPFTKFDADDLGVLKIKNLGGNSDEKPQVSEKEEKPEEKKDENLEEKTQNEVPEIASNVLPNFDACPAFSEIDLSKPEIDYNLSIVNQVAFENPTLPGLVKFIVDYARESRLHLSYSFEDIATFIAGLGTTRLQILQGMSGTGKTSLPKIFMEAILGKCEIVEVESSWKDKNELLGYYNEFSKIYTPKKFTQALYRASLNPGIMTFIVLDEMNLSRIEYYFSDFLSLMENEEDKREIKLLNVKLYNIYDNEKHSYLGLSNDHTIKIPKNVWFIGTANRDESTFEISDKVYDRAYTMNFNKRAPKVKNFMYPIPQSYVSYDVFRDLINNALNSFTFDLDDYDVVGKVEKILQPYNISFGNRVQKQIEEFVKIYCSCFNNPSDLVMEALEKVLLTKVVSKLEFKSIEDKDQLVRDFEKLKLYSCSEFISKLNEDF